MPVRSSANLTSKVKIFGGEQWTYGYNHLNQLITVQKKDFVGAVQLDVVYAYDVSGNRTKKTVDPDGSGSQTATVQKFAYDDLGNAWADLNAAGSLTTRRHYLDAVDALFARTIGTGPVDWYLPDHLGSVRDIVDYSGTVTYTANYDAFGKISSQSGTGGDRYKWTGREWDADVSLQYNRARYYDAWTGRWISQDPIGFDAGDSNLYRYVRNRPTMSTDPSGLQQRGDQDLAAIIQQMVRQQEKVPFPVTTVERAKILAIHAGTAKLKESYSTAKQAVIMSSPHRGPLTLANWLFGSLDPVPLVFEAGGGLAGNEVFEHEQRRLITTGRRIEALEREIARAKGIGLGIANRVGVPELLENGQPPLSTPALTGQMMRIWQDPEHPEASLVGRNYAAVEQLKVEMVASVLMFGEGLNALSLWRASKLASLGDDLARIATRGGTTNVPSYQNGGGTLGSWMSRMDVRQYPFQTNPIVIGNPNQVITAFPGQGPNVMTTLGRLNDLAISDGPRIVVFTRLSQAPNPDWTMHLSLGSVELSNAVPNAAATRLFGGQVPTALISELEAAGLVTRSRTLMNGVIGVELEIRPPATLWIEPFLKEVK